MAFRAFYRRRALRLMPAYLVTVALTVVAAGTIAGSASAALVRQGLTSSLTYTSNIATAVHRWDAEAPRLWEFTWSLAAEEQFYLLWPVLLVIGLRAARTDRARLMLAGMTFAGFLASTAWAYHLAAEHAVRDADRRRSGHPFRRAADRMCRRHLRNRSHARSALPAWTATTVPLGRPGHCGPGALALPAAAYALLAGMALTGDGRGDRARHRRGDRARAGVVHRSPQPC